MSVQEERLGQIAQAIREREGSEAPIQAKDFAQRVRDLPGRALTEAEEGEAQAVYEATRPKDWLTMPEPEDNEIYLLVHIPEGGPSLLAFTVTCTGPYAVELGTVEAGAFVPKARTEVNSGETYQGELLPEDWGDGTSDGMRQCMVKVSGADILTWGMVPHTKQAGNPNYFRQNVVEIRCRLPLGTAFSKLDHTHTRYFSWLGENQLTNAMGMFTNCFELKAVLALDTGKAANMSSMFSNCFNLQAVPELDTSAATATQQIFNRCASLKRIPRMDLRGVKALSGEFANCQTVREMEVELGPQMSRVIGLCSQMFCLRRLRFYPNVGLRQATLGTAFYSLIDFQMDPTLTGWEGCDISVPYSALSHGAIMALIESLPVITAAHTLLLGGNTAAAALTEEEKALAAAKNWTVTG